MKETIMHGVREYNEEYDVSLKVGSYSEGRLVICALNEATYNATEVDLLDLIEWLKENKPELLE